MSKSFICSFFLGLLLPLSALGQLFESIGDIVSRYDSSAAFNGTIFLSTVPQVEEHYHFGYKGILPESGEINSSDRYDLASLTKLFTGIAILKLIDQGRLHQDDEIGKYIPELKPNLGKVTIRQLANHTNGIHDFYSLTTNHDTLNNAVVLRMLSTLDTTVFEPGTSWGYTNSGYVLLSLIIERVVKSSFPEYMKREILDPLGMADACYLPTTDSVLSGFTADLEPIQYNNFASGSSGLYASADDLAHFYQSVRERGSPWRRYSEMARNLSDDWKEPGWKYGFGWFFSEDEIGPFRAHSGKNPGTDTYLRWYENADIFLCIMSNKSVDYFKVVREEVCTAVKNEVIGKK